MGSESYVMSGQDVRFHVQGINAEARFEMGGTFFTKPGAHSTYRHKTGQTHVSAHQRWPASWFGMPKVSERMPSTPAPGTGPPWGTGVAEVSGFWHNREMQGAHAGDLVGFESDKYFDAVKSWSPAFPRRREELEVAAFIFHRQIDGFFIGEGLP